MLNSKIEQFQIDGVVPPYFWSRCPAGTGVLSICGLFSKAVYLRSEAGKLILIHDRQFGLIPFGVGVDYGAFGASLRATETSAAITKSELIFLRSGLNISLHTQDIPASPAARVFPENLTAVIQTGIRYLECCPDSLGAGMVLLRRKGRQGVFHEKAKDGLTALATSLLKGEDETLYAVLSSLLGLGWGLTPSMDDFLTAVVYTFLYAERSWGCLLPEAGRLSNAIQNMAAERTTPYSTAYPCAAASGERFPLLDSLLAYNGQSSVNCFLSLLKIGSSSGADMLSGIVWSLQYLSQKYLEGR